MIPLIDTHTHLDQIEDIGSALARADKAGVKAVMAVGVDHASNQKNLAIKKQFQVPKIFLAMGIHPGEIKPEEKEEALGFIRANISQLSAIGEIGLDYWYRWVKKNETKKEEQRNVFQIQLDLAKAAGLPVIIHSRGAWADCLAMVKANGITRAVFHWYSGPIDVLKEILAAGFYISATPALAYSPQSREAVTFAPIEQTLIETDCPVFFRTEASGGETDEQGFRAEPKDVDRTLALYANLKGLNVEKAAQIFNDNAQTIFGLPLS